MRLHFSCVYLVFQVLALLVKADFYEVLGISKDADEKQIRSAYRQLSKQYHPDKNSSPEAHEKFIEIGEAYEVLSDKEKRENYDKYGDPDGPQHQGGDFGDMFNQFFGNFGGGGGARRPSGKPRGEDVNINLRFTLADFFNGRELGFDVEMQNICETCEGSGSADGKKKVCNKCQGQGFIRIQRQLGPMIQTFNTQCDHCNGKGHTIKNHCKTCHGSGTMRANRHYEIYLEPGTPRDSKKRLAGEGNQSPDWIAGDIILNFQESFSDSWGYRRIRNNLYRTEVLTLKEAMGGGWKRKIPFFDTLNPEITLERPAHQVVLDGEIEVIEHSGMPLHHDPDSFGKLFIEYKVLIPSSDSLKRDEL